MSSNTDLQTGLQKVGLSEQESLVYLTCLRNPKMTPTKLSAITNIKRTSLYPILQQLLDKNFIYKKVVSRSKYIFAYPPKHAMQSVSKNARTQADDIGKIAEALVKKLESNTEQLSLEVNTDMLFLAGEPGVRELVDKILDEKQDIYWIGPSKMFVGLDEKQQRELFQRLSVKRMDNGTTAHAMTDKDFMKSFYFHGGKETFRQLRTIDIEPSLNAMIVVTGNLCGFVKLSEKKPKAIIFRDKEYADILKFTLRMLWQGLSK